MFKENPDNMRMEPTPERVLSICRILSQQSMTTEQLRAAMTLDLKGVDEIDQVNKSISVAMEELNLIDMKDNYLQYIADADIISTPDNFRKYIAAKIFYRKSSTFVMFSKWFISQNEKVFPLKKWEVLAKTCGSEISELSAINENAVLGWRFWATFLGLGYLSGTMMIPNMKIRLQDILSTVFPENFQYGEAVRATDFIAWLGPKLPEADLSGKLPLAVSAALRTLHELDLIKLETWRDSNRIMLYTIDGELINDFSHITVSKEVQN